MSYSSGQPGPSEPSYRLLGALVNATVPATRKRRDETAEQRAERKMLQEEMEDIAADIVESQIGSRAEHDEAFVSDAIRRKLTRYSVDGGHGSALRYSNLVARLRSQPNRPRRSTAILEVFEQLAFSGTSAPSDSRANGRVGSRPASVQSSLLDVPNLRGEARHSSGLGDEDSRRTGVAAKSRSLRRPEEETHPSREAAKEADPAKGKAKEGVVGAASLGVTSQGRVPRSVLLERWRARMGKPQVPESELLRDMIFVLQGINGKYVRLEEVRQPPSTDIGENGEPDLIVKVQFVEDGELCIPQPTRHLIHRLAELGRLYRRISTFAKEREQAQEVGLIMQSLCHFISRELTDYYRLIAILEAQLTRTAPRAQAAEGAMAAGTSFESGDSADSTTGLTLKRLAVWTEDVALRMRLMSTIIESCRDAHGGALVSLIHSYTFNGDPFVRRFTAQLLEEVSKPFFHSLSRWIYEGELQDPFKEFFVELNPDPANSGRSAIDTLDADQAALTEGDDGDAVSLWQSKFRFRADMLPSFVGDAFGRKIFSTGKSLNFIRYSCGDSDWVATRNRLSNPSQDLRYTDILGLEQTIDSAYTTASKRLLDIFLDKFKLLDHLRALKDYLMLARGDFVDVLMQSLGSSLGRPASSLFRHNLTASLETAVRGSNAQYEDADVLRRLDARILDYAAGDTGWETFTLEYKVDSPVNTVLDGQAMLGYQTMFNHLWKIKRVELALGASWSKLSTSANMMLRIKKKDAATLELDCEAHRALVMLGEMIHFVRQMQGFCQLEVIDYSWQDLQAFFAKRQGDLDELIESHRAYLNALIGKVLLRGSKRGAGDQLAIEVRNNFDVMLAFVAAADDLSHHMTGELARRDMSRAPTDLSRPSTPATSLPPAHPDAVPRIVKRIREQGEAFQDYTQSIIGTLEKHPNLVVRDLGVRLNYNDFYVTGAKKDRRREPSQQG